MYLSIGKGYHHRNHGVNAAGGGTRPSQVKPTWITGETLVVQYLNELMGTLPLDMADEVDDLLQQEAKQTDGDADDCHDDPAVPVESCRLPLQPLLVDAAVSRQVVEAVVTGQDAQLTRLVPVVHVDALKVAALQPPKTRTRSHPEMVGDMSRVTYQKFLLCVSS